ncbi:MAG: hypothetical protein ACOYZ8_15335 [Chloroflexota bacterium]
MNRSFPIQLLPFLKGASLKRGAIFGTILVVALLSFEVFNFSTTSFALRDILGDLTFAGVQWSTILAIAFCGIDFAGIARIFTPEKGRDEPVEVWYLFGAWLLAAGFNAALTWWGISVAVVSHQAEGSVLLSQATLTKGVPVFVAVMVWLIRVLIIGTFSVAGERLFTLDETRATSSFHRPPAARTNSVPSNAFAHSAPKPSTPAGRTPIRQEPTYHPVGMSAQAREENSGIRR